MNETAVATIDEAAKLLEDIVVCGDLSKLHPADRVRYYRKVCETLGLNPFTKPFDYIVLNGKLTLYARKDATEQLRRIHRISIEIVGREMVDDLYVVTARATTPDGRTDEAIGAVSLEGLRGEVKANAIMKAETKAKRRVTLSICGLGWTDESEIGSIPDARIVQVDHNTGEILDQNNELPQALQQLHNILSDKGLTDEEIDALIKAAESKAGKAISEWAADEVQRMSDTLRRIKPEALRARAQAQMELV